MVNSLPVPRPNSDFFILSSEDFRPVECSEEAWRAFQADENNPALLAWTELPTDLIVTTRFIGRRDGRSLILFETQVESDLGSSLRFTDTYEDACRMHQMECQRLAAVINLHRWTKII